MKATKKIVCLTLAIVLAALAFAMPVSAAGATPLVIVDGFNSTKLYKNFGTENETEAFFGDDTDVETMITEVGGAFITGCIKYGLADKDFEVFSQSFIPTLNKYFEPIAYNTELPFAINVLISSLFRISSYVIFFISINNLPFFSVYIKSYLDQNLLLLYLNPKIVTTIVIKKTYH